MYIRLSILENIVKTGRMDNKSWFCKKSIDLCLIIHNFKSRSLKKNVLTKYCYVSKGFRKTSNFFMDALIGFFEIQLFRNENMKQDLYLSANILKNAKSMKDKTNFNSVFYMKFFRKVISELSQSGSSINSLKITRELMKLSKREKKLSILYTYLFSRILGFSINRKIGYLKLFTEIQTESKKCLVEYEKLVQYENDPRVFRSYSNFLYKYLNDENKADFFENAGKRIEQIDNIEEEEEEEEEDEEEEEEEEEEISEIKKEIVNDEIIEVDSPVKLDENINNKLEKNVVKEKKRLEEWRFDKKLEKRKYLAKKSKIKKKYNNFKPVRKQSITSMLFNLNIGGRKYENSLSNSSLSKVSKESSFNTHMIREKISGIYSYSVVISKFVIFIFGVIGLGLILGTFLFFLSTNSNYKTTSKFINKASDCRKHSVSSAHFLRKLQISGYENSATFFEDERNVTSFRNRTKYVCEKLIEVTNSLYSDSTVMPNSIWKTTKLEIIERIKGSLKESKDYQFKNLSLIDAVNRYGEKCLNTLLLSNEDYGNRTVGNRMEDRDDFVFVTLGEPTLHDGLEKMIEFEINDLKSNSLMYLQIFVIIPFILSIFLLIFIILYLIFLSEVNRLFKGLLFIPKNILLELLNRFNDLVTKKKECMFDVRSLSISTSFLFHSIFYNLLLISVILYFIFMMKISSDLFISRNAEYDYTIRIKTVVRRIHLWAVEYVYRDDTLFETQEIVDGLKEDINRLSYYYKSLRFGNIELQLNGNDADPSLHSIYYEKSCNTEYPSNLNLIYPEYLLYNHFKCLSLTSQIFLLIESSESLLSLNSTNIVNRKSLFYRNIIEMDNNLYDKGSISEKINIVGEIINKNFNEAIEFQNTIFVYVFIIFIFIFIIESIIMFYYPNKLHNVLVQIKEIFLFVPKDVFYNSGITDIIYRRNKLKDIKEKEIDRLFDKFLSIMKPNPNISLITFNDDFKILYYNKAAEELLNLKKNCLKKFLDFFTVDSSLRIQDWRESKSKNRTLEYQPFHEELVALYEQDEFPILVDISRDENTYLAYLENISSSKKEIILLETEKRTEKTEKLLRNILPDEIARNLKLGKKEIICRKHKSCTAFFADIVDFTRFSSDINPEKLVWILNYLFGKMDDIAIKLGVEKIKTIGDCYFAVVGIPRYRPLHAKIAMEFGIEILKLIKNLNEIDYINLHMRIGISSGEVVAGVIGKWKWCYDVWGDTINTASRMESHGKKDKIMIHRSTYKFVFNDYNFTPITIKVKGKGEIECYLYNISNTNTKTPVQITNGLRRKDSFIKVLQKKTNDDHFYEKSIFGFSSTPNTPIKRKTKSVLDLFEKINKKEKKERKYSYINELKQIDSKSKRLESDTFRKRKKKKRKKKLKEIILPHNVACHKKNEIIEKKIKDDNNIEENLNIKKN